MNVIPIPISLDRLRNTLRTGSCSLHWLLKPYLQCRTHCTCTGYVYTCTCMHKPTYYIFMYVYIVYIFYLSHTHVHVYTCVHVGIIQVGIVLYVKHTPKAASDFQRKKLSYPGRLCMTCCVVRTCIFIEYSTCTCSSVVYYCK